MSDTFIVSLLRPLLYEISVSETVMVDTKADFIVVFIGIVEIELTSSISILSFCGILAPHFIQKSDSSGISTPHLKQNIKIPPLYIFLIIQRVEKFVKEGG